MATIFTTQKRLKTILHERMRTWSLKMIEQYLDIFTRDWKTVVIDGNRHVEYRWGERPNEDMPTMLLLSARLVFNQYYTSWPDSPDKKVVDESIRLDVSYEDALYVLVHGMTQKAYDQFIYIRQGYERVVTSLVPFAKFGDIINDHYVYCDLKDCADYREAKLTKALSHIKFKFNVDEETAKDILFKKIHLPRSLNGYILYGHAARLYTKYTPKAEYLHKYEKDFCTEAAVCLAAGVSPSEIVGLKGIISDKEAMAALKANPTFDITYSKMMIINGLFSRKGYSRFKYYDYPIARKETLVIEWMLKKGETQFVKARKAYGPGGIEVSFCFLDKIDEIKAEDLNNGVDTNVQTAFENAAARLERQLSEELEKNNRVFPKTRFQTIKGITRIDDSKSLVLEGKRMSHCCASYVNACLSGRTEIFSLDGSTFEISSNRLIQHRGVSNSEPSEQEKELVNQFLKVNKLC